MAVDLRGGKSLFVGCLWLPWGPCGSFGASSGYPIDRGPRKAGPCVNWNLSKTRLQWTFADCPRAPGTNDGDVVDAICAKWGTPVNIICDRFRLADLQDAVKGAATIEPRVTRWSEAAADIRALRQLIKDGPMVVAEDSRPLVEASIAVATVKQDDQGNTRDCEGIDQQHFAG